MSRLNLSDPAIYPAWAWCQIGNQSCLISLVTAARCYQAGDAWWWDPWWWR